MTTTVIWRWKWHGLFDRDTWQFALVPAWVYGEAGGRGISELGVFIGPIRPLLLFRMRT